MRNIVLLTALVLTTFPVATRAQAVTITYWEEERPEIQRALDQVARDYEKRNPGIQVRRSHYGTEDLRVQFQTAAIGGGGPDLLLAPNDFAGVFAAMGVIKAMGPAFDTGRFDDELMGSVTVEGRMWGLPLNRGNHLILYYNKSMVPQAPATLEGLLAMAPKLTEAKQRRFALAYTTLEPFWFVPFMGPFGGKPLVGGKPELATDAMVKALALVRSLKTRGDVMPESCDYSCAETLFVEGKAAMTINGDWAISKFAARWKAQLGIAPLPSSKATGRPMTSMQGGKFFFFPARLQDKQLEAARGFVEYLVSPEVQTRLALETKRLPGLKSLANDPRLRKDPLLAASDAASANAYSMPARVEMRAVWDAIRPQLQEVMAGRTDPKTASRIMQKDAEAKIKAMR